jgi:hypothetical protein
MRIEFLLEEPSSEVLLRDLLPRIIGPDFALHSYQGKDDLMAKLPVRLRGFRKSMPLMYGDAWCVVVLRDEDRADCRAIKAEMERIAEEAGLVTLSQVRDGAPGPYRVVNRIAVEEIEAWYFGDLEALRTAYPEVPETLSWRKGFRDPDAIGGGTAEALERLLAKRFPNHLPKREVARSIAPHMDPDRNHSRSFQVFRDALRGLGQPSPHVPPGTG